MKETTRKQDKETGGEQLGRLRHDLLDALEDILQRVDKLPILDSR